ncbi:MAG: hypothetical protein ACYS18_01415 [Planctomycetota bacterium]|jgi:hypothetical protein
MKTKEIFFYMLAVLAGGCVPVMSLHPLHNEQTIVFEEKLLGIWVEEPNDNSIWEFKRFEKSGGFGEKAYNLLICDNENDKGSFAAHLVKLKDKLFLDVYPTDVPCDTDDPNKVNWAYNTFFFVPAHTFIKVDAIEPNLTMRITDDEEMEKLLKEKPDAVKHQIVEGYDSDILLTAPTEELQKFILEYANDSRVFGDQTVLARKKTEDADKPDGSNPRQEPTE